MTSKECDKITDILNENGILTGDIQDYCFEFLKIDQNGLILNILESLESEMGK